MAAIKQAQENEKEEGYVSRIYRYLLSVAPVSVFAQYQPIEKCCQPKPAEDAGVEHVVVPSPRKDNDKDVTSLEDDDSKDDQQANQVTNNTEELTNAASSDRLVLRNSDYSDCREEVPSIEIGAKEVSCKLSNGIIGNRERKNMELNVENSSPELIERAMLIFIESSLSLTKRAIGDNKLILADKLICDLLARIRAVYGVNERDYVEDTKSHPLVRMMEKLPKETPQSVRDAVACMANEQDLMVCVAEKILIMDLIEKFNMKAMKTQIQNYRQHFLAKLWPSAVETAQYELKHSQTKRDLMADEMENESVFQDLEQELVSPDSTPRVVNRGKIKHVSLAPDTYADSKKHLRKPSNYFAYASKIIASRKNTMFGQHFNKNKVKTADGWVKEPYGALETYYRFEDDGSVSVKVRGKLSTDLIRVLCIINETDLSSEWVPFLKEAKNLKIFSQTTKLLKQHYEYPVVGTKSTTVFGMAVNLLDESGCFILGCRGPPETKQDVEQLADVLKSGGIEETKQFVSFEGSKCTLWGYQVEPNPPKIRQKSADLCFMLYPMENHTLVELYANIIPEVRLVPARVVTFIIKKVVLTLFKKIAQISKTFEYTPFLQRKEEKSQFYGWIARLVADYRGKDERRNCNISICTYDTIGNEL